MTEATLILKTGREKSALLHHPWLFSGAIAQVIGEPSAGQPLAVFSSRKEMLGYAAWSPEIEHCSAFLDMGWLRACG